MANLKAAHEALSRSESNPELGGEKQNFRSCGRTAQKILPCHSGTVRQPDPVPTIPSRIETTLFKGRRERKGFGSQAMRLSDDPGSGIDPDGPGPGNYLQPKSSTDQLGERFGWGQRGTGGFASRSRRFGARSLPTLPVPGRGCPGPGMYDATTAVNKLKDRSDHLQAGTTAVFTKSCPEAVSSKLKCWAPPLPGPGQYKMPPRLPCEPQVNGSIASFKSASIRGDAGPEQGDNPATKPGPGTYYSHVPILPPDGSGHAGVNAIFKGPHKPHFCKVHLDLPMADERARKALGDFVPVVAKECVGQRPTDLPGPGIYNQDRDGMWAGKDVGIHGMSSFLPGAKRVEWGSDEDAQKPAPGQYDPQRQMKLKLTTAKSAFVSLTDQIAAADLQKGPGPCYYKQPELELIPSTSFLLNAKKRWL